MDPEEMTPQERQEYMEAAMLEAMLQAAEDMGDAGARKQLEDYMQQATPPAAPAPAPSPTEKAKPQSDGKPHGSDLREEVLRTANDLVNGERNSQYGDPKQDFLRTAAYWTVYLGGVMDRDEDGLPVLEAHDVAAMMSLLKLSRIGWSPNKLDHWVDLAGYAACGADCADDSHNGLI